VAEYIGFPDVEAVVIGVLNAALTTPFAGVKASTKIKNPRPSEFVRSIRSGGARESIVSENATILLEAYAATETRAFQILNFCRAVLFAQDDVLFGVTEIGSPANLPDPTTSQLRYVMTVGVRVRGTAIA